MLKILFTDISASGTRYEISELSGFGNEDGLALKSPVQATCILKKKSDTQVEVKGHLLANLKLDCDRCLVVYDYPVDRDMQLLLEAPGPDHWQVKEVECSDVELETVILNEPVVDLEDILRQQLHLALPFKQLCSKDCKGLCLHCGLNLNQGPCQCANETKQSPFAVLAALKKQK